jgi:hypothetical protein
LKRKKYTTLKIKNIHDYCKSFLRPHDVHATNL